MGRKIGISEQTYYRWRKRYGGMQVSQAKRLKELEQFRQWARESRRSRSGRPEIVR